MLAKYPFKHLILILILALSSAATPILGEHGIGTRWSLSPYSGNADLNSVALYGIGYHNTSINHLHCYFYLESSFGEQGMSQTQTISIGNNTSTFNNLNIFRFSAGVRHFFSPSALFMDIEGGIIVFSSGKNGYNGYDLSALFGRAFTLTPNLDVSIGTGLKWSSLTQARSNSVTGQLSSSLSSLDYVFRADATYLF